MIIMKEDDFFSDEDDILIVIPELKNKATDVNAFSVFPPGVMGEQTSYKQTQHLNPNPTTNIAKIAVDKIIGIPKINYGRNKKHSKDDSVNVVFSPYENDD